MESMEAKSSLQWTCQPLQMSGTSQVSLSAELQASPQSTHQLQQVFNIPNSCDLLHLYILVYSPFVRNKSLMLDQVKGFLKCMDQVTDMHKILCGYFATGDHPNNIHFAFLYLVLTNTDISCDI